MKSKSNQINISLSSNSRGFDITKNLPEGKNLNEFILIYKITTIQNYSNHYGYGKPLFNLNNEKIRLFGSKFVETNYSKCKLIIENKECNLLEYYHIAKNPKKEYFEIKLIIKEKISDFDSMFKNCKNLLSCPDLDHLNTSNAITFKSFFENCENLQLLPKFLNWDTKNVTNMSSMFNGCKSLLFLPDL